MVGGERKDDLSEWFVPVSKDELDDPMDVILGIEIMDSCWGMLPTFSPRFWSFSWVSLGLSIVVLVYC